MKHLLRALIHLIDPFPHDEHIRNIVSGVPSAKLIQKRNNEVIAELTLQPGDILVYERQ